MSDDIAHLREWEGRTVTSTDVVSASSCRRMEETLDRPARLADGDLLPPLWHLLAHHESVPLGRLGPDGHPARGGFLPPVSLPRRMWAGGRFTFDGDVVVGDVVEKTSTVDRIDLKEGRSGPLCFVTVRHVLSVDGVARIVEEQDLVYRGAPDARAPAPTRAVPTGEFSRIVQPSPVMLFRYSALTWNGHRIHYDADWCRDVEGYPDLVVHGPLVATMLADLAVSETGGSLASYSFRAVAPLFVDQPFELSGRLVDDRIELWAGGDDGSLAMEATARLRA